MLHICFIYVVPLVLDGPTKQTIRNRFRLVSDNDTLCRSRPHAFLELFITLGIWRIGPRDCWSLGYWGKLTQTKRPEESRNSEVWMISIGVLEFKKHRAQPDTSRPAVISITWHSWPGSQRKKWGHLVAHVESDQTVENISKLKNMSLMFKVHEAKKLASPSNGHGFFLAMGCFTGLTGTTPRRCCEVFRNPLGIPGRRPGMAGDGFTWLTGDFVEIWKPHLGFLRSKPSNWEGQ